MSQKNQLSNYLVAALKKIAINEGFNDYEFVIHEEHPFGYGFVADVCRVTIQEFDNSKSVSSPKSILQKQISEGNRKLNFVVKVLPSDKKVNEQTGAFNKFKREVYMYSEVLPKFQKLQEELNISREDGFFNFPKCYTAEFNPETEESFLILEDMTDSGYEMLEKPHTVDYQHSCLLVKALGRFHALSLAMKERDPHFFDELKSSKDLMIETITETYFKKFVPMNFHRAVAVLDKCDHKRHEIIMNLCKDYRSFMRKMIEFKDAEPFAVLTHADCWTNNLMFRHEVNRVSNFQNSRK